MAMMKRVVLAVVMVASIACMLMYAGPYRWLAELQLAYMDGYSQELTLLGTFLVLVIPAIGITRLVTGASTQTRQRDAFAIFTESRLALFGAIMAVTGLGGALWFAIDAVTVGERVVADLAAIERGDEPPSRWVVLQGELRDDLAYSIVEGHVETLYIPLLASPSSEPVVYLQVADQGVSDEDRASGTYEGVLYADDLPGMLRSRIEAPDGTLPRHFRFKWRENPEGLFLGASVFGTVGLVGLVMLGIAIWRWRRR